VAEKIIQLGLVGSNGAGKSSVCDYLQTLGFQRFSLSDIVRNEAKKLGLELIRENLIATGTRLKQEHGSDYLAHACFLEAPKHQPTVFDSIRHPSEAAYLTQQGVVLMGIDAPVESRYERIKLRSHATDFVDFETFKRLDDHERQGLSSGQNINETFSYCKKMLNNTGTLNDLFLQIDAFLEELARV